MTKPMVKRNKNKTKVIYDKKKKGLNGDRKIILFSIAGIGIVATSLGLGLGLGLKKEKIETTVIVKQEPETDNYPPFITEADSYPVRIIYETGDKIAEDTLFEIYDREVLSKTYIEYDKDWGSLFRKKLEGASLLIVLPIPSWSANKQMKYLETFKEDKPQFIHVFEFDKTILYNLIKDKYKKTN